MVNKIMNDVLQKMVANSDKVESQWIDETAIDFRIDMGINTNKLMFNDCLTWLRKEYGYSDSTDNMTKWIGKVNFTVWKENDRYIGLF